MWNTKTFKSQDAQDKWIEKNKNKVQYEVIFINNGFAVEWKPLKVINIG